MFAPRHTEAAMLPDYTHSEIVAMLKDANGVKCPRPARACRCPEHSDRAQVRLQLVTGPALTGTTYPPLSCDGTMTCVCHDCETARAHRARQAARPIRQPWEIKAA